MRIQGLQKLTLLDYPEKVACTIFTPGCNFRCPFCHNASLVTGSVQQTEAAQHTESNADIEGDAEHYTNEEIFAFLKKRRGILDGVCVSGGEPLLQDGIEQFLSEIKSLGYAVKLDTNGSFPEKLKMLVRGNYVDYVAMDIKNAPEFYAKTAGIAENSKWIERVKESAAFLMERPVPYEFRTTVVRGYHTKEAFEKIGQWIQGAEKYYLQAFVDSGDLIDSRVKGFEKAEMEAFLEAVKAYVPNAQMRGI